VHLVQQLRLYTRKLYRPAAIYSIPNGMFFIE